MCFSIVTHYNNFIAGKNSGTIDKGQRTMTVCTIAHKNKSLGTKTQFLIKVLIKVFDKGKC